MLNRKILLAFGIALVVLTLFFLFPLLGRPGTITKYNDSLINLSDIGLSLKKYAKENDNDLPDKFEQLDVFTTKPEIFESPLKPQDFNGPCYIYISGHLPNVRKSEAIGYVLAYENPEYCSEYSEYMDDTNVPFIALFLDGTVKRMKKDKFLSSLEATYEHLGKPMPEITFKD